MKTKELYEKMEHISDEQKEEVWALLDSVFHEVKRKFPSYYDKYYKKLEEILEDDALSEEEASLYVSHMENEDGTEGEHWSCDEVKSVIASHEELSKFPFWNVYYVMNMIYSDYYDSCFTLKTYVRLAYRFLNDKDAPHDKVKQYAKGMKVHDLH